jgi:hypothetical protein
MWLEGHCRHVTGAGACNKVEGSALDFLLDIDILWRCELDELQRYEEKRQSVLIDSFHSQGMGLMESDRELGG